MIPTTIVRIVGEVYVSRGKARAGPLIQDVL